MDSLGSAVSSLRSGEVIAYPTEGVWGLGCDPFNEEAISKLLNLKGRSESKGLILIGSNLKQFSDFIDMFGKPIAGGKNDGKLDSPNSFWISTDSIAGDNKDQKLAAIITPPVKPRAASKNFLLEDLNKKYRAVHIQRRTVEEFDAKLMAMRSKAKVEIEREIPKLLENLAKEIDCF